MAEKLCVESYVIDPWIKATNEALRDVPLMRFYPGMS
jgi:hypothetical protein